MELNEQRAEIGYFQDSGTHTLANMSYASLAFIHAFPEQGYHPTRNIFAPIKPIKGSRQDSTYFKGVLKGYVQLDSPVSAHDVLDTIGREYQQRVDHVFGNTALLVVTSNPTPMVDTSELRDHLGYKTTLHYTLSGVV